MEQLRSWILDLQQVVDTLPSPLQLMAILVIGVLPFLEGDVAATIGVVSGVHWLPAILLGTAGTVGATFIVLACMKHVGKSREQRWDDHKVMRRVEQWGVPIAMLVSGFMFSVPVTAFIMRAASLKPSIVMTSAVAVAGLNATVAGLIAAGMLQWVIGV